MDHPLSTGHSVPSHAHTVMNQNNKQNEIQNEIFLNHTAPKNNFLVVLHNFLCVDASRQIFFF